MEKIESLEEFYKRKFDWIPNNLKNELGHFNIFNHVAVGPGKSNPLPYKRRDFYKIMFVKGDIDMQYADNVFSIKKQALFFSNPQIPYKCEHLERIKSGFYCIFNQHFFHQFGNLNLYAVFQPSGNHVFELNEKQAKEVCTIYKKMFSEINSEYSHKYDVLRALVLDLVHFALKLQPPSGYVKHTINAAQRISTLFLELLERQFPIDENHPSVQLRTASDFALQLNIHVNHLNRAVKETTLKTTSHIIAERILQEAKIMLRHSKWNIAEIAFSLGFKEATHFNNFFKKWVSSSPTKFRNKV